MTAPGIANSGFIRRARAYRARVALMAAPESPRAKALSLGLLVLLTAIAAILTLAAGFLVAPTLTLVVPVILGGFLLDRPTLRLLLLVVALALAAEVIDAGWRPVRPGSVVVLVIVAVIANELARDRERLGLSVGRGEAMLIELRDQLFRQGELPLLPEGWTVDVAQRSAGGSAFGGDFLVSALTNDGAALEVALVDVSGKGLDAGTRALLLSGAFGGLLGSIAPDQFLAAANQYVLRQDWSEGFATALHISIDLRTGAYRLANGGHPPAVHYAGGSGRWQVIEQQGMILGLSTNATFDVREGTLAPHDALLLYTDGLVEVPGRDLSVGIDRLLGAAEGLIPRGFDGGADMLIEAVAARAADDRAVILLWRS
jgi:serine phosphatase RsbU (regulator of sigma subunit)